MIIVKYAEDTRYSANKVSTHRKKLGHHLTADATTATHLTSVLAELQQHDVIAIDEAQFFTDLTQAVLQLLRDGKTVLIAALDGNFLQAPFSGEHVQRLLPYAEHVKKLTSVCSKCRAANAVVSVRTTESRAEKVIGGAEAYEAHCLQCLFSKQ